MSRYKVKARAPLYICKAFPETHGIYRHLNNGYYIVRRGTEAWCRELKEEWDLNDARTAMTRGTKAEGL